MATPELITPTSLKDLVAANAIHAATVLGDEGGYLVTVKYGAAERLVSARNRQGQIKQRLFRSLDAAARFLREQVGLPRFQVDDSRHRDPAPARRRPDRSAALKRLHESAAHDAWFREQVAIGLKAIDAGDTLPHEDVMRRLEGVIEGKQTRTGKRAR